jgi:hypothetical protein
MFRDSNGDAVMSATFYVPFEDSELINGARNFRADGGNRTVIHGVDRAGLATLGRDDILYVIAHGRYGSGSEIVGEVKGRVYGKRRATMTASQLADALVEDGLPKNFGDLRLIVCWGGYMGGDKAWGSHTLKRKEGDAPFAGQLCGALKGRGYQRIIVTGYRGTVSFSPREGGPTVSSLMTNLKPSRLIMETLARGYAGGLRPNASGALTLDDDSRTVWH